MGEQCDEDKRPLATGAGVFLADSGLGQRASTDAAHAQIGAAGAR
jgi:hypothetical protein